MNEQNPVPRSKLLKLKGFQYPIVSTTLLSRPLKIKEVDFFETVLARRSANSFQKLDESKLSLLLFYSAKIIEVSFAESGHTWSKRPSPSAGGIHPIDLIVYDSSRGTSLHFYNPIDHSLNELDLSKKETAKFVDHVYATKSSSEKAIVLWMVAHQDRTAAKYRNAESLVWRDAGCLLYCLNLVSTALKISCCAVGSLGEPYVSRLFKEEGIYGVGGCLVG